MIPSTGGLMLVSKPSLFRRRLKSKAFDKAGFPLALHENGYHNGLFVCRCGKQILLFLQVVAFWYCMDAEA